MFVGAMHDGVLEPDRCGGQEQCQRQVAVEVEVVYALLGTVGAFLHQPPLRRPAGQVEVAPPQGRGYHERRGCAVVQSGHDARHRFTQDQDDEQAEPFRQVFDV
jgi:hypothetical protein